MYKFTFVFENIGSGFKRQHSILALNIVASSLTKARSDLRLIIADTNKLKSIKQQNSKFINWEKVIKQVCDIELIEPEIEKLNKSGVKE